MGRDLSTIARDLPLEYDLQAARLGDYDRDTVVRLFREYEFRTLIERLPPMEGESPEERLERLRSVAESGYVPAARVAGRPDGWGPARAGSRPAPSGELQLRLDFDAVSGSAARSASAMPGDGAAAAARDGTDAIAEPAGDLPTALARAIIDPGRIEVRGLDRIADLEPWLRVQSAVGAALLLDDPRPRRGTAQAFAVAGQDGRVVAADGPEAAETLRHLVERLQIPLVGHEVKSVLVLAFAEDEHADPLPVAIDTQVAAYIL